MTTTPDLSSLTIGGPASRAPQIDQPTFDSRFTAGRDMTDPSFRSVEMADALRANTGTAVDTVTTAWGRPVPHSEMKADNLIVIGGIQMKVSQAERQGLLTRDSAGHYRDATSAPQSAPQPAQQEYDNSTYVPLADAQAETYAVSLANAVPDPILTKVIHETAFGGALNQNTVSTVAKMLGVENDAAYSQLNAVYHALIDQAEAYTARHGVQDFDAFTEYCQAKHGDALSSAIVFHAHSRNPSAYEGLARAYKRAGGK